MNENISLDHLGFAVRELNPLLEIFRSLGFAATPARELTGLDAQGHSKALGQQSAHLVFGSTYLELSAVPDPAAGNHLEPFLARYQGLHILALRSSNLDASRARCLATGLQPTPLQFASRQIEYGQRHGEARFRWWMLPATDMPEGLICFVDNTTPELVYQPAVQAHPNGAVDITAVIVNSPAPRKEMQRWQQALGTAPDASQLLALDNAVIELRDLSDISPALPVGLAGIEIRVKKLSDISQRIALLDYVVLEQTSATLSVHLPAPANALLVFRAD